MICRRAGAGLLLLASACVAPATRPKPTSAEIPDAESIALLDDRLRQGEADAVIASFEDSGRPEKDAHRLFRYAKALRLRGRFPEAKAIWERASAENSILIEPAQREIASILIEEGQFREAARKLRGLPASAEERPFLRFLEEFEGSPHRFRGENSAKLPFVEEGSSPFPVIACRLEGQGSIPLLVDTGAHFCVLTHGLAKRIGLFTKVTGGVLLDLEGKPLAADYGVVGTLEMGGLRVDNVPVVLVEDEAMRWRLFGVHTVFQAQGVLGMSLLRHFRMHFDFPARTLELSRSFSRDTQGVGLIDTGLSLYAPIGNPESAALGKRAPRLFFRIDTGSNQSVFSPSGLARWGWEDRVRARVGYAAGPTGWSASLREVPIPGLRLGDYRLGGVVLSVAGPQDPSGFEGGGVLGLDLLQPFRVTIDPVLLSIRLQLP